MFNNSVDSILSGFNKAIDKLEALAERKTADVETFNDGAAALQLAAGKAKLEAGRATVVAGKIRKLVG